MRASAKQAAAGPPPVIFKVSKGPGMQSQGKFHRRAVMNRLHGLAREGFEPTPEEYSRAVTMEHLTDLVAQRASEAQADAAESSRQADTGRGAEHRSRSRGH